MVDGTAWEPDAQLIEAAVTGRVRMSDLADPDRSWAVAGMVRRGLTGEEIADRLSCSLRLVKTVRASPTTAMASRLQDEAEHFAAEVRLLRSELAAVRRARETDARTLTNLRGKLDRLVERRTAPETTPRCRRGHPMTAYNTYRSPDGKNHCRECRRQRQHRYRKRDRGVSTAGPV